MASTSYGSGGFSMKAPGDESVSMKLNTPVEADDRKCHKSGSCLGVGCYSFRRRNDCVFCCSCTIMVIALFIGVIAPLLVNYIIQDSINAQVIIDSTSAPNYDIWRTNAEGPGTKTKVNFDIFFFDVQNPSDILAGAKPIVVEKGPYAFDEYFYKFDIEWVDDGDTVVYNIYKYYVFNQQRTGPGLSIDDYLTLPYATVLGFQYTLTKIPIDITDAIQIGMEMALYSKFHNITEQLNEFYANVDDLPISRAQQALVKKGIVAVNASINDIYHELVVFTQSSNPTDLFLKLMLAGSPTGISPFWRVRPVDAYFGWLNDPILLEIQAIVNVAAAVANTTLPWTSAVPSSLTNYTSMQDARRRRQRDVYKTGKRNVKQVGKFVRYQNMSSTWACIAPTQSQDPAAYTEGQEFPACELFQNNWSPETATEMGYQQPFATPYANRVQGYNGELFGLPVSTSKLQMFSGDVYRASYFTHTEDVDDVYGLKLKRYKVQDKDLLNCSMNPGNCQYYNDAPSGMGNITSAVNAPVWISNPHFCGADPSLVGAITGLNPNPEIHTTYVDVEPQTGQIGRGMKAVQEVWRMESLFMASVDEALVTETATICSDIAAVIALINSTDFNGTLPVIACDLTVATALLTALALPSNWTYQDGVIYFPYAYCRESTQISEADANDLKSQLYDTEDFVSQVVKWSFIVAGGMFAILCTMLMTVYRDELSAEAGQSTKYDLPKENALINPLLNQPQGVSFT